MVSPLPVEVVLDVPATLLPQPTRRSASAVAESKIAHRDIFMRTVILSSAGTNINYAGICNNYPAMLRLDRELMADHKFEYSTRERFETILFLPADYSAN